MYPLLTLFKSLQHPTLKVEVPGGVSLKAIDPENPIWEHYDMDPTNPGKTICKLCNVKAIYHMANMKRHLVRKHCDVWKEDTHSCSYCGEEFKEKGKRDHHEWTHKDGFKFSCNDCGKGFNNKVLFDHHRDEMHNASAGSEKKIQCNECGKFFGSKSSLHQHKQRHNKRNPMFFLEAESQCEDCGASFPTPKALSAHRSNSQKCNLAHKHKCNECDLFLPTKKRLEMHMRTHTGETPHECEHCGKKFKFLFKLIVHKKTYCTVLKS